MARLAREPRLHLQSVLVCRNNVTYHDVTSLHLTSIYIYHASPVQMKSVCMLMKIEMDGLGETQDFLCACNCFTQVSLASMI